MAMFSSLKQGRSYLLQSAKQVASKHASPIHTAAALENHHHVEISKSRLGGLVPEFGAMWIVFGLLGGMVGVAGMIGIQTAKQQLLNSPSVQVTKKNRRSFPEVDNPDAVINAADKFVNNSFFRKVAHIQDTNYNSIRPDPFTRSRDIETLKSVGVRT